MNEMLNYMFRSMKATEAALKKQSRFNRRLRLLALAGAAYAIWSEQNRLEQQKEIEKLTDQVEELRRAKE